MVKERRDLHQGTELPANNQRDSCGTQETCKILGSTIMLAHGDVCVLQ